jgi:hypothetical protein
LVDRDFFAELAFLPALIGGVDLSGIAFGDVDLGLPFQERDPECPLEMKCGSFVDLSVEGVFKSFFW